MEQFVPPRDQWFEGGVLAIVRIAMGVLWLTNLSWKLPPSFDCDPGEGDGLCYWMEEMVEHSQIGLHVFFIEEVALPNYEIFGYFVVGGEALTGLLLVLGVFSRFAGLLGLLMSLNLYIGLAQSPGEWVWSYVMMALLHLVIVGVAAGRYFGLDAIVHQRFASRQDGCGRLAEIGAAAS